MKKPPKMEKRQVVLLAIMVLMALLVLRKYLPMLNLPTSGRLNAKLLELKSLQGDLGVARKNMGDRNATLGTLKTLTEPYWISTNTGAKLEQEINAEFSGLCRKSQLSGTQKVTVGHEKNGSSLQEITVSLDFKGITMREFTAFAQQVKASENCRKFTWEYCKISPDNPRSPRGVNCSVRFRILAINSDAVALLNSGMEFDGDGQQAAANKQNSRAGSTFSGRKRTSSSQKLNQ